MTTRPNNPSGDNKDKKPLMLEKVPEYVKLHEADPAKYPLNVSRAAEYVGVARRLFYKDDPEIAALLALVEKRPPGEAPAGETLGAAPPAGSNQPGAADAGSLLRDAELAEEIARVLRKGAWAAHRFAQEHMQPVAAEAVLGSHDLDVLLGQLRSVQAELRPLVAEQSRRAEARLRGLPGGPSAADQQTLL